MDKFLKLTLIIIFLFFLVMLFASDGGYYEYELNKKSNLTKEAITQFEQDVKDGKEIDINNYLIEEEKDYSNLISDVGINLSNVIGDFFSEGVKLIFNSIGNFVEE